MVRYEIFKELKVGEVNYEKERFSKRIFRQKDKTSPF